VIKNCIEKMDIEMIDASLDNNKSYQNFKKPIFISKLQVAFEQFKAQGDTYLIPYKGYCNFCNKTRPGFTFKGNKSKNYMSIIFKESNGVIDDLFECSRFKRKQSNFKLKERICIEEFDENTPLF
jgi:hypothetical protein